MTQAPRLRRLATDQLKPGELIRLRAMLDDAFDGYFTDDDWEHGLGGTHVVLDLGPRIVAHASVVPRRLEVPNGVLYAGYVEAVATDREFRGRGLARAAMERIGDLVRETYDIGGLSTGIPDLYERFGWERWRGPTFVAVGDDRRTVEEPDAGVMILRTPRTGTIDLTGPITCDDRDGDAW